METVVCVSVYSSTSFGKGQYTQLFSCLRGNHCKHGYMFLYVCLPFSLYIFVCVSLCAPMCQVFLLVMR